MRLQDRLPVKNQLPETPRNRNKQQLPTPSRGPALTDQTKWSQVSAILRTIRTLEQDHRFRLASGFVHRNALVARKAFGFNCGAAQFDDFSIASTLVQPVNVLRD